MSMFDDPALTFYVVKNAEGQYSLWPLAREVPAGWTVVENKSGTKDECLQFINEVWTDMRPESLRRAMGA